MMAASRDHVLDIGPKGLSGSTGSDGSKFGDRLKKYVKVEGSSGEMITYGEKSGQQVILNFLIDDGVADRGHRSNIFSKKYKKMSCFTGDHKEYKKVTVINYNGSDEPMNTFMAEEVDFGEPPAGWTGSSTNTKVKTVGDQFIKTSTRTYKMEDGSEKVKVITTTMDL